MELEFMQLRATTLYKVACRVLTSDQAAMLLLADDGDEYFTLDDKIVFLAARDVVTAEAKVVTKRLIARHLEETTTPEERALAKALVDAGVVTAKKE